MYWKQVRKEGCWPGKLNLVTQLLPVRNWQAAVRALLSMCFPSSWLEASNKKYLDPVCQTQRLASWSSKVGEFYIGSGRKALGDMCVKLNWTRSGSASTNSSMQRQAYLRDTQWTESWEEIQTVEGLKVWTEYIPIGLRYRFFSQLAR